MPDLLEQRRDLLDHLVEAAGALRAAGDQQRRQVRVEAEGGRASGRTAARSRVAMVRRSGMPM